MPEELPREVELLNAALELGLAERRAFLDEACANDPAMRQRIEELIAAEDDAGQFMDTPPTGVEGTQSRPAAAPLTEKPGDEIGRYKLLEQIGEGGCGVVYMAEQEEPVRRRVAQWPPSASAIART